MEDYSSAIDSLFGDSPSDTSAPSDTSNDTVDALYDKPKKKPLVVRTPTAPSPNALTQSQLEDVLRQAGWPESKVPTMSAIGMGESKRDAQGRAVINSYNPGHGPNGPTKEQSIGLWQINMHPDLKRPYDRARLASDPVYNAKVALELYNQREKQGKNGFTHWGAYTDGHYKPFLRSGSDRTIDSLFGDSDYSTSGAPQVKMGVGGVVEPPAPSTAAVRTFEQMFGKKVPGTPQQPAVAAPEVPQDTIPEAPHDGMLPHELNEPLPPQQLPPAPPPTVGVPPVASPSTAPTAPPVVPPVKTQAPVPLANQQQRQKVIAGAQPGEQPTDTIVRQAIPPWLAGTTPPKTPLPPDPALQQAYQQRIDQGIPDSEELRQKFLQGYAAVKLGVQPSIFTPEDRQALDQSKNRPYAEGDFAQWAAFNKVPPTPESRALFEKELSQAGPGSVTATAEVGAPTDQSTTNLKGHYENTTIPYDLRNKPANQTNKEYVAQQAANHIADQFGVPIAVAKRVVDSQTFSAGGDTADEDYYKEIAKSGGVGQTEIGGTVIRQAIEEANRQKDIEYRTKEMVDKFGADPLHSPVANKIFAEGEATGTGDKAEPEFIKEQNAYTDWLKQTGYNDPKYREDHSEAFKTDRAAALQQFGSFAGLEAQKDRASEYYKDKPYAIALGMGPEYDESVAASQLYKRTRLSDKDIADANVIGNRIKGYESTQRTGSFGSQFVTTALADISRMAAGAERILPYSNLYAGLAIQAGQALTGQKAEDLDKLAAKTDIVGETAQGDGTFFKYTGMAGKGLGGLPGLTIATVTAGGNPILGFGLHSLVSNTDKPIAEQIKGVGKDVILGTLFEGAGMFGRYAGSKAAEQFLTPKVIDALNAPDAQKQFVDSVLETGRSIQTRVEQGSTAGEREAARNVLDTFLKRKGLTEADLAPQAEVTMNPVIKTAMRNAMVAKMVAEKGASIGAVGTLGAASTKIEGGSDKEAGEQAILWGAMDAVMGILHKMPSEPWTEADLAQANEHVVRVPDADGKPRDILLLQEGDKLTGHDVTGHVPPGAADAQIMPKPGYKHIEPPSKNDWYKNVEKDVAGSDLAKPVQMPDMGEANQPADLPQGMANIAKGIGENLRDDLWNKLQKGETTEAGQQSGMLQAANVIRNAGGLQTQDDANKFFTDWGNQVSGKSGPEMQQAARDLVGQYTPEPEKAKPTETAAEKQDTQNVLQQFGQYDEEPAKVQGLDLGTPSTDRRQTEGTKEGRLVAGGEVTREAQRRLDAERTANTDPLTGVANRRALDKALPTAEADPDTSVIAFDLNNFGQVNKAVSESEGDTVLKHFASSLQDAAKEDGGRVFRKGGDEFTVLAPKDKAEAIRQKAEDLFGEKKYGEFTVSASGVVGDTFDDAESRLQEAKAVRKAQPDQPTPAESEITAPAPTDFVGKAVDIDGEGLGRLVEIRGGKALIDHQPRKVNGITVYSKRSLFPLEKVSVDGGKLSDLVPVESPKPTTQTAPIERVPEGSSVAEERRKAGKFERDGVTYERQPVINETTPRGTEGRVKFSNDEEPQFHYQLIEANQLQPADLAGNPNPYHFLPEAQPKDRSGKASAKASDRIAANLKLSEVSANPIAYSGAPVTNSRGEVIQGNNRSEAIRKHYGNGATEYKQQLADKAGDFGFTPDQVQGMKEPVLVRMLDVPDQDAIRYGNYDVKDIETGGKTGINPVATAARVPFQDKHTMLQEVFRGAGEDSTLTELIKNNSDRIAKHLEPYITEAQTESLYRKNTHDLTPQGAKEIEQLFTHFLFDKGAPELPDLFEALPHHAKNAVVGSLPKIFGVPQEASLVPDIQNAIAAAVAFSDNNNVPNFNDWARQQDMFLDGNAPVDVMTPIELELARLFVESSTQKEIKTKFADYARAINGVKGDLFGTMEEPLDKSAAIRHVFGVAYAKDTKYETQPSESPGRNEAPDETPSQSPETAVAENPSETDTVPGQPETIRTEAGGGTEAIQPRGETGGLNDHEKQVAREEAGRKRSDAGEVGKLVGQIPPDLEPYVTDTNKELPEGWKLKANYWNHGIGLYGPDGQFTHDSNTIIKKNAAQWFQDKIDYANMTPEQRQAKIYGNANLSDVFDDLVPPTEQPELPGSTPAKALNLKQIDKDVTKAMKGSKTYGEAYDKLDEMGYALEPQNEQYRETENVPGHHVMLVQAAKDSFNEELGPRGSLKHKAGDIATLPQETQDRIKEYQPQLPAGWTFAKVRFTGGVGLFRDGEYDIVGGGHDDQSFRQMTERAWNTVYRDLAIELYGPELGGMLRKIAQPKSWGPYEAAWLLVRHAKDIVEKGQAGKDFAADVATAIVPAQVSPFSVQEPEIERPTKPGRDQIAWDQKKQKADAFLEELSRLTPAQRTFYDAIQDKSFEKLFHSFLEGIDEHTSYDGTLGTYIGPNMTTTEIARQLEPLLGSDAMTNIMDARKLVGALIGEKVEAGTLLAKRVDEAVELAVVLRARTITGSDLTPEAKFTALTKVYEDQPNLNVRTSTSIEQQAYSTPVPLAFIASRLAGIDLNKSVYEPSAGNGMLLIEAAPENIQANELNPDRSSNLQHSLGDAAEVTQEDGATFEPAGPVDVVIANPPFGVLKGDDGREKTWPLSPTYNTNQIDHAIAMKALQAMEPDGRAVLIVGGVKGEDNNTRANGYQNQNKRAFYKNLYDNYKVTDHFTVHGDLYKKQGAGFPVDVILIEGRGKSARRLPALDVPQVYKSWPELGEKLNERTDTGLVETGDGSLDAQRQPKSPTSRGGSSPRGGGPRPGPISQLLSGEGNEVSKPGVKPAGGSELSVPGDAGESAVGGRDFSDSSEHGHDLDLGEPVNDGKTEQSGDLGSATGKGGVERPESGEAATGDRPRGVASEPGIKESLGAAGESAKMSLDEISKGLKELFGDPNTFGSGPTFSDETYRKAKPYFAAAYENFKDAVKNATEAMLKLVAALREMGWDNDALRRMKDYILRFVEDVTSGLGEKPKEEIQRGPKQRPPASEILATSAERTHVPYIPESNSQPMDTILPANLYDATNEALTRVRNAVGDLDEYVADRLGFDYDHVLSVLGGEQVDALALAIYNMENDTGIVNGDVTGLGKGRTAAGIIEYARKQGLTPIFFTAKAALYKDIYRDLLDIGAKDVRPLMVDNDKPIPLNDEETEFLTTKAGHNKVLSAMIEKGKIDPKYNMVFATYYGLNSDNARRAFLRQFSQGTIVVMDESHKAGGDGKPPVDKDGQPRMNTALAAREIARNAKGVYYLSATWAKRPDVMDLYLKTDMMKAVNGNAALLAPAIQAGGVPLQQVTSSMLAKAGQYLRREKTFAGIPYELREVNIARDDAQNLATSLKNIYTFSDAIQSALHDPAHPLYEWIAAEGGAALRNPAADISAIGFAQTMHNVASQMLLALKAEETANRAIELLKDGHKPIITVANTMGSIIGEYAAEHNLKSGDAVDLDFGVVLNRYLEKSRTVTVKDADGNSTKIRIPDEELGDILPLYRTADKFVKDTDWSKMPLSPIDYMHAKLRDAGFASEELTGRIDALQYNPDGTMIYRKRPGTELSVKGRIRTIMNFNGGSHPRGMSNEDLLAAPNEKGATDCVIMNQSGAEGVSAHSSVKFRDRRPRALLVAQAEANIDVHMQLLGRPNRTGQLNKPRFEQLIGNIPAERRPAAVLAKKMASLNANVTGAVGSAVKSEDVLDFINDYGDQVVAQYLADNPEIHGALGTPLASGGAGPGGLTTDGAARKATGRLVLLPIEEQEAFYDAIGSMYSAYIDQLNQLGENKLEAQTLPLDAITTARMKIFDGPGGESPFGEDAYAETVTAKKLTRPRSQAEVMQILQDRVGQPGASNIMDLTRYGNEVTRKWWGEQVPAIREYIQKQLADIHDDEKYQATRVKLEGFERHIRTALDVAHIGAQVEVMMNGEPYYGVVSDVRKLGRSKSPLASSDYEVMVLTTDASRQLRIPVSQIHTSRNPAPVGKSPVANFTPAIYQPAEMGSRARIIEAFDHGQNVRTEERTIMTGNILAAYGQFTNGRVINFTSSDGQIRQGVLMPKDFNVSKALDDRPVQFHDAAHIIQFLASASGAGSRIVESKSGDVRISIHQGNYAIMVPGTKSAGARYFNNKEILDIANGEVFVGNRTSSTLRRMRDYQVQEIVEVMQRMGVDFQTTTFKPDARKIVGTSLPETEFIENAKPPEQVAYEEAIQQRQAAEAAASPFDLGQFNHTTKNTPLYVAEVKDKNANRYSPQFRQWEQIAKRHKGYYSAYSRDGAIPGFLFQSEDDRQAFMNDTKPDTTMLSIADSPEEQDRRNAVRLLKKVPLAELAAAASIERINDRVKLNLPAMELHRRAFEQVDIEDGKRTFDSNPYPSFLGAFTDPRRVKRAADALTRIGDDAKRNGQPVLGSTLQTAASHLTDAAKVGRGTVILYVLDSKLPQEIFHQGVYLGTDGAPLTARHSDAKGLDNSPQFKKADAAFFSKQPEYSVDNLMQTQGISLTQAKDLRNAIVREEVAGWIAEGSHAEIGLTEAEGDEYMLQFMQSFAGKVYADARRSGMSDAQASAVMLNALSRFEELDYAKNAIQSVINEPSEGARGADEEGPDDLEGGQPEGPTESIEGGAAEVERPVGEPEPEASPTVAPKTEVAPELEHGLRIKPEPDASQYAGVRAHPGVRGATDLSRTPRTMRAAGLTADDVVYTVFSDKAAGVEAARFLEEHGLDGAISMLMDPTAITVPDVHHYVAAFAIQKLLTNEAVRIEDTNPQLAKELRQQSTDLGTELTLRIGRGARVLRTVGLIAQNSRSAVDVASQLYKRVHGDKQDLPTAVRERIEAKARQAESATAQQESLVKQAKSLEREVETLKKQLEGTVPATRVTKHILASRKGLVREVKGRHNTEIERALARLQSQPLMTAAYKANGEGDEDRTLFSIFDEPHLAPELLDDFAKVGAGMLLDGLAAPQMMRTGDFDEQMVGMFGEVIRPHLDSIHRESLRRRNDWLAELAKEREVKAIIRQFGDELSDEEIEAIIQERHDELIRRNTIMRLHNLRAEKGKNIKDLTQIEAIIAEIAPNPAAAAAATDIVHNKPSAHELYRTLESLGFTGKEARDALREGSDVLERAKALHTKRKAELADELRARIDAEASDLTILNDEVARSRARSRESHRELEKEFRRIGKGELKYYGSIAMDVLNTPRSLMASGDASFLRKQGGWFMFARPLQQKAALLASFDSLGQRVGRRGFEPVMEEMEQDPYFDKTKRIGIDYAHLGRMGEITKGEEVFRGNAFKHVADLTKDTRWHKYNIARAPNAWIVKSDEIYTAFLDAQRLRTAAETIQYFEDVLGLTIEDNPREFKSLASYINAATGRGNIGGDKLTSLIMNLPLFAARNLISRFQLLYKSTLGLAHTPPATRRVIMRDALQVYSILGGLLGLATMAGLSAGFDWDDPDFLKIHIGDSHVDLTMGIQPVLRPMMQLMSLMIRGVMQYPRSNIKLQKTKYNDAGEPIGAETYVDEAKTAMFDFKKGIPAQFLRRKLEPMFALPLDYLAGEDAVGQPFSWKAAAAARVMPLGLADVAKAIYGGSPTDMGLSTLSLMGEGYNMYPSRPHEAVTPAETMARKINSLRFDRGAQDEGARERTDALNKMRDKARTGVDVTSDLDTLVAAGKISTQDKKDVLSGQKEDRFLGEIHDMPDDGLKLVRSVADDGQKAQIDSILNSRAAKKEKKEEHAKARTELFGSPTQAKPAQGPEKSLAQQLQHASVEDAMVLYQSKIDGLTSEQRFQAEAKIKEKVLNSAARGLLTKERYDAAKQLLGDKLKLQFKEPKEKKVKKLKGLDTLTESY